MRTELYIEASAQRGPRIRAVGGLSARMTGTDTVHMIGTAATPLGGDCIHVHIVVGAGASLSVHSVAASLAMPGAADPYSTSQWTFEIGPDATLVFDPEPMVVAAEAVHAATTTVALTASSTVHLRERVQIGRHEAAKGRWSGVLSADVDGRALIRHRVELGVGTVSTDAMEESLAISSSFVFPDARPADVDARRRTVRLPLAAGGSLTTVSGSRLDRLA